MDKKDRNHTIKVKLNEQDHLHKVQRETAAAKQGGQAAEPAELEEEFPWVLPEPSSQKPAFNKTVTFSSDKAEESSVFVSQFKNQKKKNRNRNWRHLIQFLIAAGIAVIIGLAFTFLVLKITTAEEDKTAALPAATGGTEDKAAEVTEKMVIEPLAVTIVQGGVFSSEEAAVQQSGQFNQQGIPASVLEVGDSFYIMLFASDTIENAKAISAYYKEKGLDAFWKEVTLEGAEKQISAEDAEILGQLNKLYIGIAESASSFMLSSSTAFSEELKNEAAAIKTENITDPQLKSMAESLIQAVDSEPSGDMEVYSVSIQKYTLKYIAELNEFIQ